MRIFLWRTLRIVSAFATLTILMGNAPVSTTISAEAHDDASADVDSPSSSSSSSIATDAVHNDHDDVSAELNEDDEGECYALPFDNPNIDDGWGAQRSNGTRHRGLDFPQPRGTPIAVVADGVVVARARSGCLGHVVVLEHDDGMFSSYAHMNEASPLAEGTRVERGEVIGEVGSTGSCATGPHLHLTLARDRDGYARGETLDPRLFIVARSSCAMRDTVATLRALPPLASR